MGSTDDDRGAAPVALLSGVRVLDLTAGRAELTSRVWADLGAEVLRVALPGQVPGHRPGLAPSADPACDPTRLRHLTHNANKFQAALDLALAGDLAVVEGLVAAADLLVEDAPPGRLAELGLDPEDLLERHPGLVVVSVTDFGQTGPYAHWAATEWTHLALAGVLARSGVPGREPLLPPASLAIESAALQAAWAGLLAYSNRLDTGVGDHVDVSVFEATAQVLDPGYGVAGSATLGSEPAYGPRGRPPVEHLYPFFPCADGHVRLCVVTARQWRALWTWLGEPKDLADPDLGDLRTRLRAAGRLHPRIAALFATQDRHELVGAGQRLGVPIAAVLQPGEVLAAEHFVERQAFRAVEVAEGRWARVPNGFVHIDGVRAGLQRAAPGPGQHDRSVVDSWLDRPAVTSPRSSGSPPARPLAGLRVLDLGVIVVGAEVGRLLADQGAEVIKVENRAFPDGSRQTSGEAITPSFARGHRNKLSLGLNLRCGPGVSLFKELVRRCDVVVSNFKPGTMDGLGLGYPQLRLVNPAIVVAESSALGSDGPWSRRMGYGPLVRASTALSALWSYPDDPGTFGDASTIYPDHVAARVVATAVLAALLARRGHGRGALITLSQAETMLGQCAELFALESLAPGTVVAGGNLGLGDAPRGLYPCAGDDEWCVLDIRGDDDWSVLCRHLGRPELAHDPAFSNAGGRVARRREVDALVGAWMLRRPAAAAMRELQDAGLPAGAMQRVADLGVDEHLRARGFFDTLVQPQLGRTLSVERAPAHFRHLADPRQEPAPLAGEHTRQVCAEVLGLSASEIDGLVAAGVLEEPGAEDRPGR